MQYLGKDILTEGSLLHLNREVAWKKLRSRAKQGIRKAQRAGVRMAESRDLSLMAKVWYDPETLTDHLDEEQKLFLAYIGEELVGGIIVTPVTPNTLFYHYGGTNELGRTHEVNAYLFWHIVETYEDSPFEYLDVGVSYREELQHYFRKYCTQSYPILFHPPPDEVRPTIRINPFSGEHLHWDVQTAPPINT
ncbi:GNAT family N-acetyltransferase, partial [bacterium]|nr:GNAT family N-acetyltransferase [bacterium]